MSSDDSGAFPRQEMPDSVSGVWKGLLGEIEKVRSRTDAVLASSVEATRLCLDRILEVKQEQVRQGGRFEGKIDTLLLRFDEHRNDSTTRGQSLDGRVRTIELARAKESGGEVAIAEVKKAWIVPLGRAALGALLIAGVAGLVGTFAAKSQHATIDQATIQALKEALKEGR